MISLVSYGQAGWTFSWGRGKITHFCFERKWVILRVAVGLSVEG
jgi:hypothetical protein